MSTARRFTNNILILPFTVESGQTVTRGQAVVLASDTTVQDSGGASDLIVGTAIADGAADEEVQIHMDGWAVKPVKVGTGGATRGTKAIAIGDGYTDATAHDSDGNQNESTYGQFLQSGTANQFIGLLLTGSANRGTS